PLFPSCAVSTVNLFFPRKPSRILENVLSSSMRRIFGISESGPVANGTLKNKKESRNILSKLGPCVKKEDQGPALPHMLSQTKKESRDVSRLSPLQVIKRPNYDPNYSTF